MPVIFSTGFTLTVAKYEARLVRRRQFSELTTAAWRLEAGCVMDPMKMAIDPSDVIDPGTFWYDCLQARDGRCVFESVGGAVRARAEIIAFLEHAARDHLRRLAADQPSCAGHEHQYLPDYICAYGVHALVGQQTLCQRCHRCAEHCNGHHFERLWAWLRNGKRTDSEIPF